MKNQRTEMLQGAVAVLTLALCPVCAEAQMGWIPKTGGTYSYADAANWQDGIINGVFGTNLTSKATQTITFPEDMDFPSSAFDLQYSEELTLGLRGDGTNVTLRLQDGLDLTPKTSKGKVTFGTTAAGNELYLDAGQKEHLFSIGVGTRIENGILGGGTIRKEGSATMSLGPGADCADIAFESMEGTLNFDSTTAGATGQTRASAVTLSRGALNVAGNKSAATEDVITGALAFAPLGVGMAGATVTVNPNSAQSTVLRAGRFVREPGGYGTLRGTSLGATPGPGVATILFDETPDLVGGGEAAGSSRQSILPGFVGSLTTSGGVNASYDWTLVTYDPVTGVRPLDLATEYCTNLVVGSVGTENLYMDCGTTLELSADTTINALLMQGADSPTNDTTITGSGELTVTSGMVLMGYHRSKTPIISVPLNFGSRQGVILYAQGKRSSITAPIRGTGGVVFGQIEKTGSGNLSVSATCEYSGDTYVCGYVSLGDNSLPYGDRPGDVYVYSKLMINSATINGLYGNAELNKPNSGSGTIAIGDNDSDGDFEGNITNFGTLNLRKIGAGHLRLAGRCSNYGTTRVEGGTLQFDGTSVKSAFIVHSGAILGGCGTISNATETAVSLEAGAVLAPGGNDGTGTLSVVGGISFAGDADLQVLAGEEGVSGIAAEGPVSGTGVVTVSVDGTGIGRWKILEAASIEPAFVSATSGVVLALEGNGTELWAERVNPATVILLH